MKNLLYHIKRNNSEFPDPEDIIIKITDHLGNIISGENLEVYIEINKTKMIEMGKELVREHFSGESKFNLFPKKESENRKLFSVTKDSPELTIKII